LFRTLKPAKVYVTDDVYGDPAAAARVETMMSAIEPDAPLQCVTYDELNDIAPQRWSSVPRWGAVVNPRDPDLVLTTGKFWSDEQKQSFLEKYPNLATHDLAGFTVKAWRRDGETDWRKRTAAPCASRPGNCTPSWAARSDVPTADWAA